VHAAAWSVASAESPIGAGRYTREQFELMIGSEELPEHAHLFAALGGLAGFRLGAIAGLRWGDLDTTAAPLWRLTSSRTYEGRPTKSQRPSAAPVHPVLASMLTTGRHGWGRMFGRAPTADDPIVPRTARSRASS
jgi:integrase